MEAFIYTAMTGAAYAQRALGVRANNLANAQTAGFRADLVRAESLTPDGVGYDSRHLAHLVSTDVDVAPGPMSETGRSLDVAIAGAGYLTVETDDGPAYTRAGHLSIDGDGALTVNGRPVLGDGGPIVLPAHRSATIGGDGTISVVPSGESEVQTVARLLLVNPDPADLVKNPEGLLVSRSGAEYDADETVTVKGGHLEGSNISAIEEMMQTLSLTRSFEMQMRLYRAADEMADTGNRLIRG
ncbi:flagellar basal body rod protein FlgF [Burkholderia dolosa]|uniref:Flagellar basal-body rod protein FlgF n=1 Tax=Burkholderia dolosa TaxID=152500 RepID=A0A892IHJ6_9BURK|nr:MULTISPECIES: flagellar basal body rod protein FlgF [Burkholderia]AKE05357.1 flagellar basal body rod protein FlgF [Burkholderia cepacia]AJY10594.1 flagellar hook-basal body family protein [Burkholderia dolosa AU0158]AYZ94326.1 flagellar basal body rod protein FlgF [Burkholderia dolosa]EAY71576.1 Flagellar basal body rod protein [Burkholderia dolosa AU0158]ETP63626.1 flagellar basal body rod protein FlgF [Burkholderia dolosa PC543]